MNVKIFSQNLNNHKERYQNDLDLLELKIQRWRDETELQRGKPLENVRLAQSHTETEIIVTVWYD